MICGFSLGAAVGGFVAASLIPRFGWQSVFIVGGIVPIAIARGGVRPAAGIDPVPARPGGAERAAPRSYLARIAPERHPGGQLSPGPTSAARAARLRRRRSCSRDGRAAATLLIWVVYFMNLLNLYFLNSWLPTIISDAGIPVATAIRADRRCSRSAASPARSCSAGCSIARSRSGFWPAATRGRRCACS